MCSVMHIDFSKVTVCQIIIVHNVFIGVAEDVLFKLAINFPCNKCFFGKES